MIIAKPWSKGYKMADRREWWREYRTEAGTLLGFAIVVDLDDSAREFWSYTQEQGIRAPARDHGGAYRALLHARQEADTAIRRRLGIVDAEELSPPEMREEIVRLRVKLSKLQARKRDLEERSSRLLMAANDIEEKQISRVRARLRDFGLDS